MYQIKVNGHGVWEIHRAGCTDLGKDNISGFWNAPKAETPEESLALDIMENYGGAVLGEPNENGEIFRTFGDVLSRYEGRVMPCCKHK